MIGKTNLSSTNIMRQLIYVVTINWIKDLLVFYQGHALMVMTLNPWWFHKLLLSINITYKECKT